MKVNHVTYDIGSVTVLNVKNHMVTACSEDLNSRIRRNDTARGDILLPQCHDGSEPCAMIFYDGRLGEGWSPALTDGNSGLAFQLYNLCTENKRVLI